MPFSIIDDVTPVSNEYPVISLGHDVNGADPGNGFILVEYLGTLYYYELRVDSETDGGRVHFVEKEYKDKVAFAREMEGRSCYIQSVSTINAEEEKRRGIIQAIQTAGNHATTHPTEYHRFSPHSWCEWLSGRGTTQDDIEKQTAFQWARGKLIDCVGDSWTNKVAGGSTHLKRIGVYKQFRSSFVSTQLASGPLEFKERNEEAKSTITGKTYALVDVDETLILNVAMHIDNVKEGIPDEYLNMHLINALLKSGVTDLYLFTAMRQGEQGLQERQALITTLERKGFKVHGMITPADYVFSHLTEKEIKEYEELKNQTAINKFIDGLTAKITGKMTQLDAHLPTAPDKKSSSSIPVDIAYNSITLQLKSLDSKSNQDASRIYNDIDNMPIPDAKGDKGKIYLRISEGSVSYEAVNLEGELKRGVILRNNLPNDFPMSVPDLIKSKDKWLPILSQQIVRKQVLLEHEQKCNLAMDIIMKLEAERGKLKNGCRFNHKGLMYQRFKQYLPDDLGRCLVFDDRQDVLDSVQTMEEKEKDKQQIPLTTVKVNVRTDRPPVDSIDTYLDAIHIHNNPHRRTGRDLIAAQINEYERSVQGCTWFVPHVNRKRLKLKALKLIKDEMTENPTQTPQQCFEKVYKKHYAADRTLWQEIVKGTQTRALIEKLTLLESSSSFTQSTPLIR